MTPTLKVDHYAMSVKMSTYLVAFVVCDYERTTTQASNRTRVSIVQVLLRVKEGILQAQLNVVISINNAFHKMEVRTK